MKRISRIIPLNKLAVFILLLAASQVTGARDLPLDRIKLPPGFTISKRRMG